MYIGMGRHQMPGDVWWRSWRTPPPQRCSTDPASLGHPGTGYWQTYTDPQSGKRFPVWEGHYTYPGTSLTFVPDVRGRDVRGADGQPGRARDELGTAQLRPERRALGRRCRSATRPRSSRYPGVGYVAVEHGRRHRRLRRLRRRGPGVRAGNAPLAWCTTCATETTVSPHASAIALPVLPQQAYANLVTLRADYPGIYTADGGFYDAVNPVTGSIGHRRLVLDQSMIMAALDDALNGGALQRRFAADPESWAARVYLSTERMSIH